MQREMSAKGIKREEVHATHAVLYGAAAGYAVSCPLHIRDEILIVAWVDSCGSPSTQLM